ncbi:sodium-dependent dicarboxylate transporter sdcS [Staphylococcus aureus]|nr:sodium-dependent dicarboxylate transporter sdcS [Staphylococcus aureus]
MVRLLFLYQYYYLLFQLKNTEKHRRIIDWEVAKELPWGVLILFGGGLALAKGISEVV